MIFACAYSPTAVNISLTACIFRHTSPSWRALDAAWSRAGSGGKTSPRLDPDWLNVSAHTIPFRNDPTKASCRSVSVTASNPSWPLGVIGEFPCLLMGGGSTSHGPAAVQPTPKTGPPRPHLPERGHTKAQRKTESCHEEPPAMNQNEYHMMPNHTVEKGRRGASPQCYYD